MLLVANAALVGISLLLGLRLIKQYLTRPRPHTFWYAIGLVMTALAALPELYHRLSGTLPTSLWWLYWFLGSSLVGALAVGTSYLVGPRWGKVATGLFLIVSFWLAYQIVRTAGPFPGAEAVFHKVPTAAIKWPFLVQNIAGASLIFGGALWSLWRTREFYNIWIALGTAIFSAGGASSGLLRYSEIFAFTQTSGILLLYVGVSQSLSYREQRTDLG